MGYGENEVTTNDQTAQDMPECPHNEEYCEWQHEYWGSLKTTGYEHRVCRNCRAHLERRPQDMFVEMLSEKLGVPKDSGFMFNQMAEVLAEIDEKRWADITSDTLQEVKDG